MVTLTETGTHAPIDAAVGAFSGVAGPTLPDTAFLPAASRRLRPGDDSPTRRPPVSARLPSRQ